MSLEWSIALERINVLQIRNDCAFEGSGEIMYNEIQMKRCRVRMSLR